MRVSPLVREVALSVATLIGATAVMSAFFPVYVATLCALVVATHEWAHVYVARARGGSPVAPLFVPLGVGIVGATRVRGFGELSPRARRYTLAAGPAAGVLTVFALAPLTLLVANPSAWVMLLVLGLSQAYSGVFGSDGRRWRKEPRCDSS